MTYEPIYPVHRSDVGGEDGHTFSGRVLDADLNTELPAPTAPMAVARQMVAERYSSAGDLLLRHWRGGWWQWRRTHWEEREERSVRADCYAYTEHASYTSDTGVKDWDPNRNKIQNLLEALAAITHLAETVNQPSWLETDGPPVVAVANGLLNLADRVLLPHSPRYFNQTAVPFDYDPKAEASQWLAFLKELWPEDQQSIDALAEFFGYVVSGRLDQHKILLMVGPTRGGKGTMARILGKMIGSRNVAGPTLSSLSYDFGMAPLIGKPLAVISDARLDAKANTSVVVERLLSISGEDTLTVNRKYREQWTGKLPTRFMVISNEMPRLGDASGTIANRFVALLLRESWLGKEDTTLEDRLSTELAGILNWSLAGLDRLVKQTRFTRPASTDDVITTLQDLASPVSAFVRDRCKVGPMEEVPIDTLYAAWKIWADDNGHRRTSVQTFGRDLRAVLPRVRTVRPRDGEQRERVYRGVSLSWSHSGPDRGPSRTTESQEPPPTTGRGDAVRADSRSKPGSGPQWSATQANVAPTDDGASSTSWCEDFGGHQSDHRQIATGVWWCGKCRIGVEVPA